MAKVFQYCLSRHLLIYYDDLMICIGSILPHLDHLKGILDKLQEVYLTLNSKESYLFQEQITYLGMIINSTGIKADPAKTKALTNLPRPSTLQEVR